jgi:hypothetical protein
MRGCFESAGLNQKSQEGRRADYAVLAELSRGLSGGNILNICVNAIYAGSVDSDPAKWRVKMPILDGDASLTIRLKMPIKPRTHAAFPPPLIRATVLALMPTLIKPILATRLTVPSA